MPLPILLRGFSLCACNFQKHSERRFRKFNFKAAPIVVIVSGDHAAAVGRIDAGDGIDGIVEHKMEKGFLKAGDSEVIAGRTVQSVHEYTVVLGDVGEAEREEGEPVLYFVPD